MKIIDIEFGMLCVLLKILFKIVLCIVDIVEDVVVLVCIDSGYIGYGEVLVIVVIIGDIYGLIIEVIIIFIKLCLIGQDVVNFNYLCGLVQFLLECNISVKVVVEIVFYDLWVQLYNVLLYCMFGGGDLVIIIDIIISVDYIDKMVVDLLLVIDCGFELLKIKVGKDIGLDIEWVKVIYVVVQGCVLLCLDVNQGWIVKQVVYVMCMLEEVGVVLELLEQLVKVVDISGLKYVIDCVNMLVMVDESVFNFGQVVDLIQQCVVDIINIKLMKIGGFFNVICIVDIVVIYGVLCMIGCMIELSISVVVVVYLVVVKSEVIIKVDLDGFLLGQFNLVIGGVNFNELEIIISDVFGLGIIEVCGLEMIMLLCWQVVVGCYYCLLILFIFFVIGFMLSFMLFLVKICFECDYMLVIECCIVDFIFDNVYLLCDYLFQQLVSVLGISQFSVVKFSQKLGFKGYLDLKYLIGEVVVCVGYDLQVCLLLLSVDDDYVGIVVCLCLSKVVVEEEIGLVNLQVDVEVIVWLFDGVFKVFVYGLGDDGLYVCEFVMWLLLLGMLMVYYVDLILMMVNLLVVWVGDVMLVFFEFGKLLQLFQLLWQFQDMGGKVVLIICYSVNLLCVYVDWLLVVCVYDFVLYVVQLLYCVLLQFLFDFVFVLLCYVNLDCYCQFGVNLEWIEYLIDI